MKDRVTVFVNEDPVTLHRGMRVRHALVGNDHSLYKACLDGRAEVRDEHGNRVGLEGALEEGARLFVKFRSGVTKE